VVIASAILAATGYGVLLGTVVDTYEQASMFGPISIVIAAAIGGIMVPVYAMPAFMQSISVVSPLAWGLNGSLDVFVRGGGLADVLPETAALTAFFGICVFIAWLWQRRRSFSGNVA
ncbi:ABC transporter permease, partial [Desulfosarcina sp.]|uniref:ABC transporter permease n=1 Tax=Desulfosarcina sp. TaxID=2027861 RepID=UPI0029A31776